MKILKIFKKEVKNTVENKTQTLDKTQLSKVIGGTDAVSTKEKGISICTTHVEWSK